MHTHVVFFWLNEKLDKQQRQGFENGLLALSMDKNVLSRKIGVPAKTNRPVIDSSYDFGMTLQFENLATHDAYQTGEVHQLFLDNFKHMWAKVQVYDIESTHIPN